MSWWCETVAVPCEQSRALAFERQRQLIKPPGSLGRLESLAVTMAALQGKALPALENVVIRVFAADHGVAAEGVSAYPQAVTVQMIHNFSAGGAAIAVLAGRLQADFAVVNVGTEAAVPPLPRVIDHRIAAGTANFCEAAAMTDDEVHEALTMGARQLESRCDLFIGGEMGIANSTTSAALAACLLDLPPAQLVGPGTGVDDSGVLHKQAVVQRALSLHRPRCDSALEVLRRLGGLEIAALCGAYIASAQRGVPVLVDGFIASVAALVAVRLNPGVRQWMLFAHRSAEPGHAVVLEALDAQPLVQLEMRLGEGSGAAVACSLLRDACALHNRMVTFAEAGVSGREGTDD